MMNRIAFLVCGTLLVASSASVNAALLLHYAFDEVNDTTTPDSSALSNTGTLAGGMSATNLVPGKIGNALRFEGGTSATTADRVEVPENDADFDTSFSEFTFAAWVKPTADALAATGTTWIAGKMHTGGNRGWQVGLSGTDVPDQHQLFVSYFDGPSGATQEVYLGPNAALASDTWMHFAVVFKANESLKFYVNGELALTDNGALGAWNGSNNAALQIGNRGRSIASSWNGLIDEVYIFDDALDARQIRALVPEPPAYLLITFGAIGLAMFRRRTKA